MAIVVVIILALAVPVLVPQHPAHVGPAVQLISDNGNVTWLNVEIADTPGEHAQGLMNRSTMSADSGMLFVFTNDERRYFWMKNTLIPLDMIFIDDRLTIIDIHKNATPLNETVIASSEPCRYVLEVNGGMCEAYGVSIGDHVRLDFDNDVSGLPQDR